MHRLAHRCTDENRRAQTHSTFCLTERDLSFVRLPDDSESKAALDSLQGLYDRLPLMGMNELEAALRCMHGLWFAPLDEAVHSRRLNEITVIPHYRAHLIPFHALLGSFGCVLEKLAVDYSPSFSVHRLARVRGVLDVLRPGVLSQREFVAAAPAAA